MKPLLFNSGAPTYGKGREYFLNSLGPYAGDFRGRNNGNGYISYATLKAIYGKVPNFDNISNAWTHNIDNNFIDYVNSNYSQVIFFMQDFLSSNFSKLSFENFNKFLSKIKIPVCPISLGINGVDLSNYEIANSLNFEQVKFAKLLSDKCEVIGVRGAISFEVLNSLGIKNVHITGCPSYFENGPNKKLEFKPFDKEKIITTGCYFNNKYLDCLHLLQDELFFIRPMLVVDNDTSPFSDNSQISLPNNLKEIEVQLNLYDKAINRKLLFFKDYDSWRQYYLENNICLTIGTRLHSAIQALNSNSLSIVTNGDLRAKEVCEYFDIPVRLDVSANDDLIKKYNSIDIDAMNKRYKYCYNEFQNYLKIHNLSGLYNETETDLNNVKRNYLEISDEIREYFAIHRTSFYQIINQICNAKD